MELLELCNVLSYKYQEALFSFRHLLRDVKKKLVGEVFDGSFFKYVRYSVLAMSGNTFLKGTASWFTQGMLSQQCLESLFLLVSERYRMKVIEDWVSKILTKLFFFIKRYKIIQVNIVWPKINYKSILGIGKRLLINNNK